MGEAVEQFGREAVLADGDLSLVQLSPDPEVLLYLQAGFTDQPFSAASVEEPQVRPIEEALFGVVEPTFEQAQAKRTVRDIRDRDNRNALGREMRCRTPQDRCRVALVFEHVEREDDVEGFALEGVERFRGFEIGDDDAIANLCCRVRGLAIAFNAPDRAAPAFQRAGDRPVGRSEIQHPAARRDRHHRQGMRRVPVLEINALRVTRACHDISLLALR